MIHQVYIATVDLYPLKSLGPGRLLATFLCLLLPSLSHLMFESVSPLIVSITSRYVVFGLPLVFFDGLRASRSFTA